MRYLFGEYVLDTARRELHRGAEAVPVEPQVFDLLEFVIRKRHRVVSKDDLMAEIWNGRIVSESTLASRINAARRSVGDSGKQQMLIRTIARRGFRFVGKIREETDEPGPPAPLPVTAAAALHHSGHQKLTYCRMPDGVSLAVATSGSGLPLVKAGTWLSHVEQDWQGPWAPLFARLAARFQLVRYDPRGCGLSEWNVPEISFDALLRDLETVVDTLGLRRFALYGISQGTSVSIAYAARHPERVSRLVLSGGRAVSWRKRANPAEMATHDALLALIQHGWGQSNPAFRQVFTTRNWPDATVEELRALDHMQRISTSPENAVRIRLAYSDFDLTGMLPQVSAPTLVLHSREDAGVPLELGLQLAQGIANARLVTLDSRSHLPLPTDAAWSRYADELCAFLEEPDNGRLRLVAP